MSVEIVACCGQLSCGTCRNTPCKCHHRRNSQADIFLQRFHLLGRCLPVSPVCSQSLHHEWKFDDTTGEECTKQEALTKKGTCSPIHSTLPMAESDPESSLQESDDDIDVDDDIQGNLFSRVIADITGGQNTFLGSGDDSCALPSHAVRKLSIVPQRLSDFVDRKLSDPAVMVRKEKMSCAVRQQRRFSDGNICVEEEWSEEGSSSQLGSSSHLGCDSGYNDDIRSKFQASAAFTFTSFSLDMDKPFSSKTRRLTPHPLSFEKDCCQLIGYKGGCEGHLVTSGLWPKRQSGKHHSVSSIGGTSTGGTSTGGTSTGGASSESPSMTSIWECDSPETVTDILSNLGFDDFDNPQLVPDRFIPSIIEHAKPSLMRLQLISEDGWVPPSGAPDSTELPLGATAETYLQKPTTPPVSPPPVPCTDPIPIPRPKNMPVGIHLDPAVSQFARTKAALEPVPEETASDLSPSPRWFSPRVSIDHSLDLLDLQEGKLGSALLQKQRKRSLPQREGYRHSLGSQVESEPDSIYFSVTSYDEDIAREREREREELCAPPLLDDPVQQRRRRRGVYTPPPGLMTWLSSQHPISEEQQDPDELPWPFSEQARLRKSLTEIELAQQSPFYEPTANDGCGQDSAPMFPHVRISPCRSPQLSDNSDGISHQSGHSGQFSMDSYIRGEESARQESELLSEERQLDSDTRQLDSRQLDSLHKDDRRPSLQHKKLTQQKAEDLEAI